MDYLAVGSREDSGCFSFTGECVFKWNTLRDFLLLKENEVFDLGWGIVAEMIGRQIFRVGYYDVGEWKDVGAWKKYLPKAIKITAEQ